MTTPVARKLGMKSGVQALIIAAPPDYLKLLAPLPDALTVPSSAGGKYQFVQVFATRLSDRFAQKLSLPSTKPGRRCASGQRTKCVRT
jgi:hypothetical protein